MKKIILILSVTMTFSNILFCQSHLIQFDLNNIYKFYYNESDTLRKNLQNKSYVIPTLNYSFITKNNISHSVSLGYYKINLISESFRLSPTVYYKINQDYSVKHFSIGYGIGKLYRYNDFLIHSQIITEFKSKSKYLDHRTTQIIDTFNGTNYFITDNNYLPKQIFLSMYFKETVSHKIYKNFYLGLGLGYGLEYSTYIGNRIVTSDAVGAIPSYEVSNKGIYTLQMNIYPSISVLYNFARR
jgi:hypothetical protein